MSIRQQNVWAKSLKALKFDQLETQLLRKRRAHCDAKQKLGDRLATPVWCGDVCVVLLTPVGGRLARMATSTLLLSSVYGNLCPHTV
ncbi:unnamed protein product [Chondrus crispus]|uniref:Uncharacterized protein n=1 Tax=Chondrus crispus TaxID=2769 RepID=R7Q970_CHOCR|nr:unnamed protein product [Chondrus crispus]CDF35072.1 unnamed protein product [Chondrus crispus]|eukprot:XP_005714891.1 unnamed protein product [Chondrus crispus]